MGQDRRGESVRKTGVAADAQAEVVCPSCGEIYDSPERVTEVLRNSGFCLNLTCLQDLTTQPFEAVLLRTKEDVRAADRRAV
jgi:hypothetical protein